MTLHTPAYFVILITLLNSVACTRTPPKHTASTRSTPNSSSNTPDQATKSHTLPNHIRRGVCLAHNWQNGGTQGYGTQASLDTLTHLESIGATWVSITPFGWMDSAHSTTIKGEHIDPHMLPAGGETQERIEAVIKQAQQKDFKVMLKPHIWIHGGLWRGEIAFDSDEQWAKWWENYSDFTIHYAHIAERLHVESLVLGVELVSAVKQHPEHMLELIQDVRKVYSGELTYSANWDENVPDKVWRNLDAIGVQLYPPLSNNPEPTVQELQHALRPHLEAWSSLGERLDRPVLITEVGYKSAPTAVSKPFEWPEHLPESARIKNEQLQAHAYDALLSEIPQHQHIHGLFLWKYFTNPVTDEEGVWGFCPRGKLAEDVIKKAFQ